MFLINITAVLLPVSLLVCRAQAAKECKWKLSLGDKVKTHYDEVQYQQYHSDFAQYYTDCAPRKSESTYWAVVNDIDVSKATFSILSQNHGQQNNLPMDWIVDHAMCKWEIGERVLAHYDIQGKRSGYSYPGVIEDINESEATVSILFDFGAQLEKMDYQKWTARQDNLPMDCIVGRPSGTYHRDQVEIRNLKNWDKQILCVEQQRIQDVASVKKRNHILDQLLVDVAKADWSESDPIKQVVEDAKNLRQNRIDDLRKENMSFEKSISSFEKSISSLRMRLKKNDALIQEAEHFLSLPIQKAEPMWSKADPINQVVEEAKILCQNQVDQAQKSLSSNIEKLSSLRSIIDDYRWRHDCRSGALERH